MLFLDFVLVALGLFILVGAGDVLVKGAVNLALRLGIPALIVSLTIVAFGTSAPELLISIKAVSENAPGLALGNVVGSNTANILMVLGVPALLFGMHTADCKSRRSYMQMIAATIIFIAVSFLGPITWVHGVILLAGLAWMLWDAFGEALDHKREVKADAAARANGCGIEEEVEGADPDMSWKQILLFLALGLLGLPLGADLLVDNAVNIAVHFGVSETVIGLTLVAFGTSLPELAAVLAAAYRGHSDVALGNVIGSNMFNLLAIIGIASFFGDLPVPRGILNFDLWVMAGSSLLLIPFVFLCWNITRVWGAVLSVLYLIYLLVLLS